MTALGTARRDLWTVSSGVAAASSIDRALYVAMSAFVLTLPFSEELPFAGQASITTLLGLVVGGLGAFRLLLVTHLRPLASLHLWMLAFAGWVALSSLWTIDSDTTATRIGTYAQLLIVVWLIWEMATVESRVLGLLQCYAIGTCVASLIVLWNYVHGRAAGNMMGAAGGSAWDTDRYTIEGFNANDLGLAIALSIPILFYLLERRRSFGASLWLWANLVLCCAGVLLTGSRGSALAASIGMLMGPLAFLRMQRWQRGGLVLVFAAMLVADVYLLPASTFERLASIGGELQHGTLTHRTVIWSAGLEAFRTHALLGVGAGSYGAAVFRAIDVPYVAHNTFLSVLVELGVVGALLFAGLLISLLSVTFRMKNLDRYLWVTLFLTWMVGVSALAWEYRKPTWLLFGLLAAHAYARRAPLRVYPVPQRNPLAEQMPQLETL